MVSPEPQSMIPYAELLLACLGALASIAGVWFAGVRRTDKADAAIVTLKGALADTDSAAEKLERRVDKLRDWQQREIGKSERSDVRTIQSNPDDTRA